MSSSAPAPSPKADAAPLLQVRHLRVEFNTRRGTLVAVDDVSFDIAPGEVLGVVGESGAGKSITGTAIIGLLERPGRVASGEILLEGNRIDNLPAEQMRRIRGRRIGAIFQDPLTSLNPLFTVGQQITETIQQHLTLSAAQARARAIELLGEVGIPAPERRIDHYPHQFSGGMRQRVVDRVGLDAAVHAQVRVAVEDGPPRERHVAAVRHPDEAREADDGGYRDGGALGAHDPVTRLDDDSLLGEDEDDSAAHRHDAQGLVRGVEHQRSGHCSPPTSYQSTRRRADVHAPSA